MHRVPYRITWQCGVLGWTVALLLSTVSLQAAETDHPLLSGMTGFDIRGKKTMEFDRFKDGPIDCGLNDCKSESIKEFTFQAEGRVTELDYSAIKDVGELAILRNYENAIRSLGGVRVNPTKNTFGRHVFRIDKDGATTWIALNITSASGYRLAIIEPAMLAQTVRAGQLAEQIKKQGFATLYINFDTAKSDLKADAQGIIKEVATMLKGNPDFKISIEGHTDNVGDAKLNKKLSEDRARSVMKAVVAQNIDPKRLSATGFGMEQPVADNRTEEGRAKNRRVELVKR